MEYKTFLKTEYSRWVSFLAKNGHRVPGVSPDVPVLIEFPRDAKDNLRKVILALKATDDQKNQLYASIKGDAAKACLQRKVAKAMAVAGAMAPAMWKASEMPPMDVRQWNHLQYVAQISAAKGVLNL